MKFKLPPLPYPAGALSPHISKETLEFHHDKHLQTYVNTLNNLLEQSGMYQKDSLEEIMQKSEGSIFNNAAQVWNHTFYFNCMSPNGGEQPGGPLAVEIKKNFDSFDEFRELFTQKALSLFGSGYVWLVKNEHGTLSIEQTKDADNPLVHELKPLLSLDVWEHAYYIDYRNVRAKYVEAFWKVVNWEFVESQLQNVHHAVHM